MPTHGTHPDQPRMSFTAHLEELRLRMILALLGVAAVGVATLTFGRTIVAWLCVPLTEAQRAAGIPPQLYTLSPVTGFTVYIQVSLIAALIVASPWVLYQTWRFFESGLYAGERRVVLLLAPFSALMSTLGLLFLYYLLLPACLWFLIAFATTYPVIENQAPSPTTSATSPSQNPPLPPTIPVLTQPPAHPQQGQVWMQLPQRELRIHADGQTHTLPLTNPVLLNPLIEIGAYLSFVAVMAVSIVLAFQLPVVMTILSHWGIVDPAVLSRYRRHCVFGCFALAALFPPPDVLSMVMIALPIWGLFELGLFLMRMTYRRRNTDVA